MIPVLDTDVLVVGGGGAGVRAALSAAESEARVLMVLKGIFGSSGATAYRVSSIGDFDRFYRLSALLVTTVHPSVSAPVLLDYFGA